MDEKYDRIEELAYDCYSRVCAGFLKDKNFMESLEENKDFMENFQEKYRFEPGFKKLIISKFIPEFKKNLIKENIKFDEAALEYVVTEFCNINNKNYFVALEKEMDARVKILGLLDDSPEFKQGIEEAYSKAGSEIKKRVEGKCPVEKIIENYFVNPNFNNLFIEKVMAYVRETFDENYIDESVLRIFVSKFCDERMQDRNF